MDPYKNQGNPKGRNYANSSSSSATTSEKSAYVVISCQTSRGLEVLLETRRGDRLPMLVLGSTPSAHQPKISVRYDGTGDIISLGSAPHTFIGGRVNDKEHGRNAAQRECSEEVGLQITVTDGTQKSATIAPYTGLVNLHYTDGNEARVFILSRFLSKIREKRGDSSTPQVNVHLVHEYDSENFYVMHLHCTSPNDYKTLQNLIKDYMNYIEKHESGCDLEVMAVESHEISKAIELLGREDGRTERFGAADGTVYHCQGRHTDWLSGALTTIQKDFGGQALANTSSSSTTGLSPQSSSTTTTSTSSVTVTADTSVGTTTEVVNTPMWAATASSKPKMTDDSTVPNLTSSTPPSSHPTTAPVTVSSDDSEKSAVPPPPTPSWTR